MRAVVVSAGQIAGYERVRRLVNNPDLVICADGGVRHAEALGLRIDMAVGDFDSAPSGTAEDLSARGIPVTRVPADKEWTDTEMAVREALERGATDLLLLGCTGDRLDHTLANLHILGSLPRKVRAVVADANNIIRVVGPGERLELEGSPGDLVSLVPLSEEVTGISITGVKWPLQGAALRWGVSRGVSNEFVERTATVAVVSGYLFVIQSWDSP